MDHPQEMVLWSMNIIGHKLLLKSGDNFSGLSPTGIHSDFIKVCHYWIQTNITYFSNVVVY